MKTAVLFLLGLAAVSHAAPAPAGQWDKPIAFDDGSVGGVLERRSIIKVEVITAASSSPFTNEHVTKVTKYVKSKAKDTMRKAARPIGLASFFADSRPLKHLDSSLATPPDGEIAVEYTYGRSFLPCLTKASTSGRHGDRHHRHRISPAGFRNRLAFFMLGFAVLSALACSFVRRSYIQSLSERDAERAEDVLSEKERLLRDAVPGESVRS